MKILTKSQMTDAEKRSAEQGVSLGELMDNAGYALYSEIKSYAYGNFKREAVILVGSGNNGGDGLVASNLLCSSGIKTAVILVCGEPKTELAKAAFSKLSKEVEVIPSPDSSEAKNALERAEIIVDCVFGTGFHGEFKDGVKELFEKVGSTSAYKIACDLPSGIDSSNGFTAEGTVKFDKTVSFHAAKLGTLISPAREFLGELSVCKIGIPENILPDCEITEFTDEAALSALPERPDNAHKGTFGRLTVIAGSDLYPGAALMCTKSALKTGVGLVNLLTTEKVVSSIVSAAPEATFTPLKAADDGSISADCIGAILKAAEKSNAVLIGCGLMKTPDTVKIVRELVLNYTGTLIIDADGINCLCENIDVLKDSGASIVLTPHPAELSRLLGKSVSETLSARFEYTRDFCIDFGVTMISKSRESYAANGKKSYLIRRGNSALSKGGSGDMLAGIIASLAAQGVKPPEACALGSFLLGLAAEELSNAMSKRSITATDILNFLPYVLKIFEG